MLQTRQLDCKFSNNAMQSLATIAKSGETKRVLDADSEEMKDESKFEVFTKLQRILLQKNAQKCVKGDRGSGNNLFFLV